MARNPQFHWFNCDLAAEIGVVRAVLFQNIAYWVQKNEANNSNIHEGKAWTYNSGPAFAILFPYLPRRTIMENLQKMEHDGYLLSRTDLNGRSFNRTKWYTIGPAGEPWRIVSGNTSIRQAESAHAQAESAHDKKEQIVNKTNSKHRTLLSEASKRLADLLLALLRSRKPDFKRQGNWAKDIDLMIRVDHRTPDDIEAVIHWCQADPFWCNNILSGVKLRKHYDQLDLQRKQTAPTEEDPETRLQRMREKGLL